MLWASIGAVMAVFCEYVYRAVPDAWMRFWWLWVPVQTAIGYTVYRLVSQPQTTLIDALILWTLCTAGFRILATWLLGDTVSPGTWAGLCLVLVARVVQMGWR